MIAPSHCNTKQMPLWRRPASFTRQIKTDQSRSVLARSGKDRIARRDAQAWDFVVLAMMHHRRRRKICLIGCKDPQIGLKDQEPQARLHQRQPPYLSQRED